MNRRRDDTSDRMVPHTLIFRDTFAIAQSHAKNKEMQEGPKRDQKQLPQEVDVALAKNGHVVSLCTYSM